MGIMLCALLVSVIFFLTLFMGVLLVVRADGANKDMQASSNGAGSWGGFNARSTGAVARGRPGPAGQLWALPLTSRRRAVGGMRRWR